MKLCRLMFGAALVGVALPAAAGDQMLMIPDSANDSIGLYNASDGSLIDANFIVDANDPNTYDFSTPKEALQVGNQIWVSDQLQDSIFIFDLNGNWQSTITGGMDNIRGMAVFGDTVYVSNSGTNNGAPGDAIITINAGSQTITGNFSQDGVDPFDVAVYNGNLLVSDISTDGGGEGVVRFAPDGTFIDQLVSSDGITGIDFAQQVSPKLSDSNFLVAGFSTPDGLYEYDSSGAQVDFFADTAGRGVFELLNGNYLYTSGGGTFVFDTATGGSTFVGDGSQYISTLVIPGPGGIGLFVVAAFARTRRRRG